MVMIYLPWPIDRLYKRYLEIKAASYRVKPFSNRGAYQCKITKSTGMATQMELEVLSAKSRGHPDF